MSSLAEYCRSQESGDGTLEEIAARLGTPVPSILDSYFSNRKAQVSAVLSDSKSFSIWKRARHVYEESLRVMGVLGAPLDGPGFGSIMSASHVSCKNLFECSCEELDVLVDICVKAGALGSRLTGAGWGGCTVSCVEESRVQDFVDTVTKEYYNEYMSMEGPLPDGSICVSLGGSGATIVEI